MSTNIWMIRLRPLGPFYFGSERNFSAGNAPGKVNYLSKSNYFPQQTALLGMLRYRLLEQAGMVPISKNKQSSAKALIGSNSFNPDATEEQDFGAIVRLSPVFIQQITNKDGELQTKKRIFRAASEYYEDQDSVRHAVRFRDSTIKVSLDRNVWQAYRSIAPPYLGKYEVAPKLVDHATGDHISYEYEHPKDGKTSNGVFCVDWRIGISIKDREEAFYKQCHYRFAQKKEKDDTRGYCFAFYAEIDDKTDLTADHVVQLGGDRSVFMMSAKQIEAGKADPLRMPSEFYNGLYLDGCRDLDKVVLLSDTRLDAEVFRHIQFAIVQGQEFRNNQASVQHTTRYGPLTTYEKSNESGSGLSISDMISLLESEEANEAKPQLETPVRGRPYFLLAAGSVLYCDNPKAITDAIDRFENFQKIGYNHYLHIPKS